MDLKRLRQAIREVPDFPKPGINFYDITTLLKQPELFIEVIHILAERHRHAPPDVVVGIESRGFILAGALASSLGAGFVPIRKFGKLPAAVHRASYSLEYGTDSIEMHIDALAPGSRVLLVDDLLATGGTASAAVQLIETVGAKVVEVQFLIELLSLNGAKLLAPRNVYSILQC